MKTAAFLLSATLAAGLMAGCGDPQDPCQVNPTKTAASGDWVEADGEPLDDDPCDSDDLGGDGHKSKNKKKVTPTKKR
jgi:hypothetical protein